jgi:hypothetical protein
MAHVLTDMDPSDMWRAAVGGPQEVVGGDYEDRRRWIERYMLYPGYVIGYFVYECTSAAIAVALWTVKFALGVAKVVFDSTVGAAVGFFWRVFTRVYESFVAPLFYFAALAGAFGVIAGIVVGACAVAIQGAIPPLAPPPQDRDMQVDLDDDINSEELDNPTPTGLDHMPSWQVAIPPLGSPKGLPAVLATGFVDKPGYPPPRLQVLSATGESGLFPYEDEDGYFGHSSPERRASMSNDSSPISSVCGTIAEEDEDDISD